MVKKTLLSMAIAAAVVSLAGCNVSTTDKYDNKIINEGVQYGPTSSVYPIFAPEAGQVPLAIDFLFADAGASDGTANTAPDSENPVITALNKLDGFSTVAPLYIEFSADIDPNTVVAGQSVFLVKLRNGVDDPSIDALNIDTILASNPTNPFSPKPITPASYEARYITMDDGRTPAIQILLKEPLEPKTKYLVVLTDGIKGTNGETIGQSTTYAHAIGSDTIVNPALAPVRGALQGWQQLAQGFLASGTPLVANAKGKAVFNYAFTTGGTDDVLKAMAAPGTFLTSQMPTYMHAEGAIKGSVEKQVREGYPENTPEETIQTAIETNLATKLGQVAQSVGLKLNEAGAPGSPFDLSDGTALRTTFTGNANLLPYYYAGLITAIADGQGAGLDTAVDKPQSRSYQAIASSAGAVKVTYNDFFTPQVAPKVAEQITSIAIGEGAITQAVIGAGGSQTVADGQLDSIAIAVAEKINANGGGPLPTDATVRPILKSTAELQPHYLAGLRAAITKSQVDGLSSKGAIYQGGLEIPSYLPASEAGKADSELGTWVASEAAAQALGLPGAPRDCDGVKVTTKDGDKYCENLDLNKTNVTYRFPFAKKLDDKTIPVMVTLPAVSECGGTKPADGWPVAIYQHGITVDRTAGVLVGNALASACVAMVAIDHTMHGVAPGNATDLLFSVNTIAEGAVDGAGNPTALAAKSPFAVARAGAAGQGSAFFASLKERHNNVGKNAAQANVQMNFASAGAEANVGASGDLYINLNNFARTRDAMRQTVLDLMNLNATIGDMDVDADGSSDFDASKVYFVGHSLGAIIGTTFVAVNNDPDVQAFNGNLPKIQAAILGNAGGGVVKLLENSPSIGGAKILPGLQAAAGLEQGSADIEKFFGVMQAMVDSADPINFVSAPHMQNLPILSYTAVDDLVVPNTAETATVDTAKSYLSGTDPLVKALGITEVVNGSTALGPVMETRISIRTDAEKSDHSTFSNAQPAETFAEIFRQIGFFISDVSPLKLQGINVQDTDVLEQVE